MKTLRICGLLGALLLSAAPSLFASSVIFNDFGPGYAYDSGISEVISGSGSGVGYDNDANPFTSSGTFVLTQIDVAIGTSSGSSAFTLELDSDNANSPGAVLTSWTVISGIPDLGTCCTVETLIPTSAIELTAGTKYWLVARPADPTGTTFDGWALNTTGATGNAEQQFSPDGSYTSNGNALGAFDVLGASPVPEPASFGLTAGALAVIAAFLRRLSPGTSARSSSQSNDPIQ